MPLSQYIFPLILLAIASIIPQCPILAMNSAAIPGQTFVPRPSKSSPSASPPQSHIPTVGSNSPNSMSLKKSPKRNSAALKVKASMPKNNNGPNFNGKEENNSVAQDQRIFARVKAGKQEFIIRWAEPSDLTQLYGIYCENNQKNIKSPIPKKNFRSLTEEEEKEFAKYRERVEEFQEEVRKRFVKELSGDGPKHGLVAEQIAHGMEKGVVGYLLFQFVPDFNESKIINMDDFYILPNYRKRDVEKALFQSLINLSEKQGIEAIEWNLVENNENDYLLGEIDKMAGIEKDPHQGAIWRLPKAEFENIRREYSHLKGIKVNADEIDPNNPFYVKINVKQNGMEESVANAQYRGELLASWSARYIWLQDLEGKMASRETFEAIFGKLIEIFRDQKVDGIAWIADRNLNEKFARIFESLGAIRNYHRWNLLKNGNENS